MFRLSLQEFRYTGRRQLTIEITASNNRDNTQPISNPTTKKSMTLPARMQPPTEFIEETTNSNCPSQLFISPPFSGNNGTGSIDRVENLKKGF